MDSGWLKPYVSHLVKPIYKACCKLTLLTHLIQFLAKPFCPRSASTFRRCPWAQWSLCTKSILTCKGLTLLNEQVHQGSPLWPLLFSLALNQIVAPACQALETSSHFWSLWYMDEGTIYGELSELEAIFLRLLRELPLIGLHMNPSKCILVTSA